MNRSDAIAAVKKQLAENFNCKESDFDSYKLIVTELDERESRAMKAVCFGGSAVFCAKPKLAADLRRIFEGKYPDWIFETNSLIMISEILYLHGHNLDNIHEYFIPDVEAPKTEPKYDMEIIENGFDHFKAEPLAKEVFDLESHGDIALVAAAKKNGKIIGMAAAFEEGGSLWQINLAVAPEERFGFAAENILSVIKDTAIEKGKIPYFGGPFCKISHSTGTNAGFFPCWSQIVSRPRDDEFLELHGTR